MDLFPLLFLITDIPTCLMYKLMRVYWLRGKTTCLEPGGQAVIASKVFLPHSQGFDYEPTGVVQLLFHN